MNNDSIKACNFIKPDVLPQRKYFPINTPIFGNLTEYVELPDFIENQLLEEPFNKNQFQSKTDLTTINKNEIKKNLIISRKRKHLINHKEESNQDVPFENYSEIEFYLNGIIDKIIYAKFPIVAKTIQLNNNINLNSNNFCSKPEKMEQSQMIDHTFGISKVKSTIQFESRFESGNLFAAYQINDNNYQLVLQNDTNTNGYNQWFFFKVMSNEKKTINFNIINMSQRYSLFNEGMKICVYSMKKANDEKIGWYRDGNHIKFYQNGLYKFVGERRKNFSSLSFQYSFKNENEEVYFAMNIPFTYTKMSKMLIEYSKDDKKYK